MDGPRLGDGDAHDGRHVQLHQAQPLARGAREGQQANHHLVHAAATVADHLQHMPAFIAELVGEVALEPRGEILHEQQRGAQVVRDGIGEGFQVRVGNRQLLGALLFQYSAIRRSRAAQPQEVLRAHDHRRHHVLKPELERMHRRPAPR